MSYLGKVRVFVHKLEKENSWDDGFEVSEYQSIFDDCLISDVAETGTKAALQNEIYENQFQAFVEDINAVLISYQLGDVVEILCEVHLDPEVKKRYYGDDYSEDFFLEKVKHRKLTTEQIRRFAEDLVDPNVVGIDIPQHN